MNIAHRKESPRSTTRTFERRLTIERGDPTEQLLHHFFVLLPFPGGGVQGEAGVCFDDEGG